MKTNFRRRFSANPYASKRALYVLLVLVAGILAVSLARSPLISVARPLWQGENAMSRGFRNLIGFFRSKEGLLFENQALREQVASYEELFSSYRVLEGSEERLLASFGRSEVREGLAAGVLVHPPQTPYDILVIDVGRVEGVALGDKVSQPEGGALGTIAEVYEHESKVSLYTASGIETPAYLERGDVAVVLRGMGGGTFEFRLPRDVAVEAGDKLLLGGIRAELVGVVREVDLEPTDSEKRVIVSGVDNVSAIRFVIVR